MIIELDTKLLDLPEKINMNQFIFLSMILDKNQKSNQSVRKIVSLISDDDISYLINNGLVTSIERDGSITYQATQRLKDFMAPPKDYFDLFYDMYPVYVVRPDGTKCYLRANINKCRHQYNLIVGHSGAMARHLLECLDYELKKRTRENSLQYMKTMWKWIVNHEWEAVEEEMSDNTPSQINSYGTDIY
jgi:hypothetical protein